MSNDDSTVGRKQHQQSLQCLGVPRHCAADEHLMHVLELGELLGAVLDVFGNKGFGINVVPFRLAWLRFLVLLVETHYLTPSLAKSNIQPVFWGIFLDFSSNNPRFCLAFFGQSPPP